MAFSSLAQRTTTFTATTAACIEWRNTSVTDVVAATAPIIVAEIAIHQATATACSYGLGRAAAVGVTPVNVVFTPWDNGYNADRASYVSQAAGSLSWGTSPTVPTSYFRRWNSAAAIGESVIWTFPVGLIVPATVAASLVIWNISTTVACDVNCVIQE